MTSLQVRAAANARLRAARPRIIYTLTEDVKANARQALLQAAELPILQPPTRDITISASQLDAMSCKLMWHLGYRKGYRARKRNMNLLFGDGIHQALEAYYGYQRDPVLAFEEWADRVLSEIPDGWADEFKAVSDLRVLGIEMLTNYLKQYPKEPFTVLATEQTLRKALPDPRTGEDSPYILVVRLDGLIRDHTTGRLMSLEHKSFRTFNREHLNRDHQMTAQVWMGQFLAEQMELDEEVIGVLYNGLRKAFDTPRTRSPLFERLPVFRTHHELDVFAHRAFWQAHEYNQPDVAIYPQPNSMRCGWCEFKDPCLEYMRGGDYQLILDEMYTSRDRRVVADEPIVVDD